MTLPLAGGVTLSDSSADPAAPPWRRTAPMPRPRPSTPTGPAGCPTTPWSLPRMAPSAVSSASGCRKFCSKQIMTDGNDGVRNAHTTVQRERPQAARRSGRGFSRHPGASGEQTGRCAALTRRKRQGADFSFAIWVVPRSFHTAFVPLGWRLFLFLRLSARLHNIKICVRRRTKT